MKRFLLLALPLLWAEALSAQQMRLQAQRQQNNNVDLVIEGKTYPGTMTVFLNFKDLTNCNQNTGFSRYEVTRDKERVTTLRPVDASRGVGYGYSCRFYPGRVDSRVDTLFVYRMPCSQLKKEVKASVTQNIRDFQKDRKDRERLGLHLDLEQGDTVYAMRRGIVVRTERVKKTQDADSPQVSYSTRNTRLVVEHPDGSMATYSNLDPDLLVEEGDYVLPSTPLALAGTFDGERYSVNVLIARFTADPGSGGTEPDKLVRTIYFLPVMALAGGPVRISERGVYTPEVTRELLTREMTKKELKQLYGNKK